MAERRDLMEGRRLNCVAIGGGNGLSTLLLGLKAFVGTRIGELAAIVAVTDDGGSSGRLRDELQMPPPGDIRNCMVALSEDSLLLSKLFRFRFGDGHLGGHSFGNLFLAALAEITGDFTEAVKLSSEVLASKGRIYPATDADVRLAAVLSDGTTIRGETNISKAGSKIERIFLEPETCHPLPDAISAIQKADLISVGPGSLYTSLLPPLLVHGVADAIADSRAAKIFICNLMTQPGETDGLTSRRHIELINDYVPQIRFDYLLINNAPITMEQAERYEHEGAEQIGIHGSISGEYIDGAKVVYDNLLDEGIKVRHAPERLANAVLSLASA